MKYELQTIPVWRAFEAEPECSLCYLEKESEGRNVTFFLGNSIMAPEIRVELNEHGFCRRHFHMLLGGQGKLGYSLALNTHLRSLMERYAKREQRIMTSSGRTTARAVEGYADALRRQERDCLMCDRIRANMLNFTYTIAKLYLDEPDFEAVLSRSKGFCLHHLPQLLEMGSDVVPAGRQSAWHQLVFDVQHRAVEQLSADLEAFTWQFDYQAEKKTPEHARDAVPRAVARLAGYDS